MLVSVFIIGLVLLAPFRLTAQETPELPTPELERGKQLALRHCSACHPFPKPELLDRATWQNGTRPFLRARLGLDQFDPHDPVQRVVLDEWDLIWKYYLTSAPEDALKSESRPKIQTQLPQFTVVDPKYRPGTRYVTLAQIDEDTRRLYVGNAQTKTLDVLDGNGAVLSSLSVDSPPVGLVKRRDNWICTLIGLVPPHNQKIGKVVLLQKTGAAFSQLGDLLQKLPRPTHCSVGDLNADGLDDLVVSGFGNILGALTWYETDPNGQFRPHVLFDRPGAVATEIVDLNRDGRPDIIAMMAQAKEGVYALLNNGRGEFKELPILEQHPVWGYSGFQLVDFNHDGHLDLLTTNGDNGEYPSCLKNYHGVRLYLNDGKIGFNEAFFIPLNGAFKAIAADFDQDGDMDIASISYFADYEGTPEESFVYIENHGGMKFEAFSFPGSDLGRWLVMDVGDVDGDGDLDIAIGSANRTPYKVPPALYAKWTNEGPSLLLLKNNLDLNLKAPQKRSGDADLKQ